MSVKASSWVWEHSKTKGTTRLVLLALADHAGADGGDAYPSVARLCERCGLSQRTVQHALRELVRSGEVLVDERAGPRGVNRYQIVMTPADPAPPTPAESAPPQNLHPADVAPHPRSICTPPPQNLHLTPAESAPEPNTNQLLTVQNQLTRDLVAVRRPLVASLPGFDEFWSVYPRRAAKGAARKAWAGAVKRAEVAVIVAGAARYRDDPNRDPDFTAHPATWLNADRWEDEPVARPLRVSKQLRDLQDWGRT